MAAVSSSPEGELPDGISEPRFISCASFERAENSCTDMENQSADAESVHQSRVIGSERAKLTDPVTAAVCCETIGIDGSNELLPHQRVPNGARNLHQCSNQLDVDDVTSKNVIMQNDDLNVDRNEASDELVSDSDDLAKGNSSAGSGAVDCITDSEEVPWNWTENDGAAARGRGIWGQAAASDQLKDGQDRTESEERGGESSSYATTASSTSGETDDSVEFGGYTVNRIASDDSDSTSDGSALMRAAAVRGSDDESMAVSRRLERVRRKRLHSRQSSPENAATDSDSDSGTDDDIDAKSSRLDVNEEAVAVQLPADTWRPAVEIFRRQIGGIGRQQNTSRRGFTRRVGGSVHLVSRLTLYDKHEVHNGCVNALHFNETGSLIASGSDDLKIVIFDWIKKRTFIQFDTGHRSNVFQCKFLPHSGDCHLVTCARDGQVRLAQLSATGVCNRTKKLAAHRMAAHKLALLNDSPHVFYSCGEDSVVFQIDLRQEQPNKCYTTKENDRQVPLYSIHANPSNSNEHCVGGRDQYVRIYDVRMIQGNDDKKPLVKKFCPHHLLTSDYKAHITCAVYNYNGTEIIGSYNDEDIYLFDAGHSDGAQYIHKYFGHRNNATVKGVNFFGPESEFVVSGSDCGNVFIWHRQSEQIVNYFHADDGGVVNVLEPHPHIPLLATSGLDNDIKLWMPTATEPSALNGLQKTIQKNKKEREDDRNEPDVIDSQMLWFLMHTLRRNAARRAASSAAGVGGALFFGLSDSDVSEDSDTGGPDNNDDDDDDGGDEGGSRSVSRSHCTTS